MRSVKQYLDVWHFEDGKDEIVPSRALFWSRLVPWKKRHSNESEDPNFEKIAPEKPKRDLRIPHAM